MRSFNSDPSSFLPSSLQGRYQITRDNHYASESTEIIQLVNPGPLYLASPVFPLENTIRHLLMCPLSPLPPDQPWCFPDAPSLNVQCPLLLGTVSDKQLFSGISHLLICCPHHT